MNENQAVLCRSMYPSDLRYVQVVIKTTILTRRGMVHGFVALQMPKDQQVLAGLLPAFVEVSCLRSVYMPV